MPYRRNLVKMFEQFHVASRRMGGKMHAGLHARVMPISSTLYRVGRHGSAFIKGLKCALNELGICDDFMAGPFHRFREPERALVRARLGELGLLSEPTAA
ncbi:MAG: dihydrodipicolinate synthase [Rariglobus sp.]|nr:dihydrodipicolinate synthase [Rariglobus sp.]